MVGFQTKPTYGEQKRIFRMIPGLERAEFARLGGVHRNTFINSPRLLDLSCASKPCRTSASPARSPGSRATSRARRSACSRPLRGRRSHGEAIVAPPATTALGALLAHITRGADAATFQPMNVNFGLFRRSSCRSKAERKPAWRGARWPSSMPGWRGWPKRPSAAETSWPAIPIRAPRRMLPRPSIGTRRRHRRGSTARRRSTSGSRR